MPPTRVIYLIIRNEFSNKPLLGLKFLRPHTDSLLKGDRVIGHTLDLDANETLLVLFCSWYGETPSLAKIQSTNKQPVFNPTPEITLLYTLPIKEHELTSYAPTDISHVFDMEKKSEVIAKQLEENVKQILTLNLDEITTGTPVTKAPQASTPVQAPATVKQPLQLKPAPLITPQPAPKSVAPITQSASQTTTPKVAQPPVKKQNIFQKFFN